MATAVIFNENGAVYCSAHTSPTPKPPSAVTPSQSVSSPAVKGSSPVGHLPVVRSKHV